MSTYTLLLSLHNLARWAVLGVAVFALFRAASGLLAKGGWLPADEKARRLFPLVLDIQVTVGVLLSFVSPLTTFAWGNMATAMGDKTLRYYAVEHGFIALAALVLAHMGAAKIRRLKDARTKFKTLVGFYLPAVVLLVARIPWDRPFFRMP